MRDQLRATQSFKNTCTSFGQNQSVLNPLRAKSIRFTIRIAYTYLATWLQDVPITEDLLIKNLTLSDSLQFVLTTDSLCKLLTKFLIITLHFPQDYYTFFVSYKSVFNTKELYSFLGVVSRRFWVQSGRLSYEQVLCILYFEIYANNLRYSIVSLTSYLRDSILI